MSSFCSIFSPNICCRYSLVVFLDTSSSVSNNYSFYFLSLRFLSIRSKVSIYCFIFEFSERAFYNFSFKPSPLMVFCISLFSYIDIDILLLILLIIYSWLNFVSLFFSYIRGDLYDSTMPKLLEVPSPSP